MATMKCRIKAFGKVSERETITTPEQVKKGMTTTTDALTTIGFVHVGGGQTRTPLYLISFFREFEDPMTGIRITITADFT